MSILISDTARNNLSSWATRAIRNGYAIGACLSPFTSPDNSNGYKKSAKDTADAIRQAGGEFWFDPMTYALDMPRTTDFKHYNTWGLSNRIGEITTPKGSKTHIKRIYEIQTRLGSQLLAPTLLLTTPNSTKSQQALEMSCEAINIEGKTWLTIAGDQHFWSTEDELDAHIGALDQLEPSGWFLVVTRDNNSMPPKATPEEIYGLMRTTYALSQDRPVHISFGDLAGLPAVAAGASTISTGWDLRQRICAYQDFEERPSDQPGGGWYHRPALYGLMGRLSKREYMTLTSEKPTLAKQLAPGEIGPKPEQAFKHHAQVLSELVSELNSLSGESRVKALCSHYEQALPRWKTVASITGTSLSAEDWIHPFQQGLRLFTTAEGWD